MTRFASRRVSRVARRALPVVAVALAGAGSVVLAGPAQAATSSVVSVPASDDTYDSSARPTYTFGSSPSVVAGAVNGDRMVAYLKFKLAPPPAGTRVGKVELKLTREDKPWPATVKVKALATSAWSESTLTYRTAPATGADLAVVNPSPTAATLSFDLSKVVTGPGTYSFAVTSPGSTGIARFRSAESSATHGPTLKVTLNKPDPAPAPPPSQPCTVDAKLVPTCNLLWGAAAGGFSATPRDQALREWDAKAGRTSTIYHTYHRGDELFPTPAEIAMARDATTPRLLLLNWKVAYGSTWAKVAAGEQDARIDRLAAHLKTTFPDKFFLVPHHEPENDVNPTPGSGMTATDYAAMYRHTVTRLKAQGVSNAVFVMANQYNEKFTNTAWWKQLYPGDDVVDWLGIDSYVNAQPGGYHHGDFKALMNRTTDPAKFEGWYTWATTQHPGKPIMVAEWGVYDLSPTIDPANKVKIYDSVLPQLKTMPAIKALVYFDGVDANIDTRIDNTPQSLDAFKRIAADPIFNVKLA